MILYFLQILLNNFTINWIPIQDLESFSQLSLATFFLFYVNKWQKGFFCEFWVLTTPFSTEQLQATASKGINKACDGNKESHKTIFANHVPLSLAKKASNAKQYNLQSSIKR